MGKKPAAAFRILHTADWHLGKMLNEQSREVEQKLGPNTGSGRYSLGTDTKRVDNVRIWYQEGLVTA